MVLSVQCTLQDAGKHERRNNSVNISFRFDYGICIYMYSLQFNIQHFNPEWKEVLFSCGCYK